MKAPEKTPVKPVAPKIEVDENKRKLSSCDFPHDFQPFDSATNKRCKKCKGELSIVDANHYQDGVIRCGDFKRKTGKYANAD